METPQEFFRAFFSRGLAIGVIGVGYNGVIIRYRYQEFDWILKVQQYTADSRLRLLREIAVQDAVATRLADKAVTGALCPLVLSYDSTGIDSQIAAAMGQILPLAGDMQKFGAYESLLARWGYSLAGGRASPLTSKAGQAKFNVQLQRFCGSGTLRSYGQDVLQQNYLVIRNEEVRCWFFELAWALHALHSRLGVIHNDLSAGNITLDEESATDKNRLHRFLLQPGAEWSFLSLGTVIQPGNKSWLAERVARENGDLYEYAVPVQYGKDAAAAAAPSLPPLPWYEKTVAFDEADNSVPELGSVDQDEFRGRGMLYKMSMNPLRPRIIDFGQSVLLQQPEYTDDNGTEFGYLNDVSAYGAKRVPYPEFYFTRSLNRSYETDVWDLATAVMDLCLAGYDVRKDVEHARIRSLSSPSGSDRHYAHVSEMQPARSMRFPRVLEFLRADLVEDAATGIGYRSDGRMMTAVREVSALLKNFPDASADLPAAAAGEMLADWNVLAIEQMLLTLRLQRALGNGILPGVSIAPTPTPGTQGQLLVKRYDPWPEIQYTAMYRAVLASPAARNVLVDADTTLFENVVVRRLDDVLGKEGVELVTRRMMAWNPQSRLRGGYAETPGALAAMLKNLRLHHTPELAAYMENAIQPVAGTSSDGAWSATEAYAPFGAGYILVDSYFSGMATTSTLDKLPIGSQEFTSDNQRDGNAETATTTTTAAAAAAAVVDWATTLTLPLNVYHNQAEQQRVTGTFIGALRGRLQAPTAMQPRGYDRAKAAVREFSDNPLDSSGKEDSENVYQPYAPASPKQYSRVRTDVASRLLARPFYSDGSEKTANDLWAAALAPLVPSAIKRTAPSQM